MNVSVSDSGVDTDGGVEGADISTSENDSNFWFKIGTKVARYIYHRGGGGGGGGGGRGGVKYHLHKFKKIFY